MLKTYILKLIEDTNPEIWEYKDSIIEMLNENKPSQESTNLIELVEKESSQIWRYQRDFIRILGGEEYYKNYLEENEEEEDNEPITVDIVVSVTVKNMDEAREIAHDISEILDDNGITNSAYVDEIE